MALASPSPLTTISMVISTDPCATVDDADLLALDGGTDAPGDARFRPPITSRRASYSFRPRKAVIRSLTAAVGLNRKGTGWRLHKPIIADKVGPNEIPDHWMTIMSEARHSKGQPPIRVFVSHSAGDAAFARKLRNLLWRRLNAQVFSADDMSAGERWEAKLRKELAAADVVVALLTPSSVHSSWVLQEIGAAWGLGKPIIPVVARREILSTIPLSLSGAQVIELADVDSDENADKFVSAFEESLAAVRAA